VHNFGGSRFAKQRKLPDFRFKSLKLKNDLRFKEASQIDYDKEFSNGNPKIVFKGWAKFLKYVPEKGETMNNFFFNPSYLE